MTPLRSNYPVPSIYITKLSAFAKLIDSISEAMDAGDNFALQRAKIPDMVIVFLSSIKGADYKEVSGLSAMPDSITDLLIGDQE